MNKENIDNLVSHLETLPDTKFDWHDGLRVDETALNIFVHLRNISSEIIGHNIAYEWPRLQEAYKHAFGKEFEGAHDAMSDIRATKEIYFWLIKAQISVA